MRKMFVETVLREVSHSISQIIVDKLFVPGPAILDPPGATYFIEKNISGVFYHIWKFYWEYFPYPLAYKAKCLSPLLKVKMEP